MVRVTDLDEALDFYCNKLGLQEVSRRDDEKGKYTNVFLKAPGDLPAATQSAAQAGDVDMDKKKAPLLELTYNWPAQLGKPEEYTGGRNFGHVAYAVDNIYEYCERLQKLDVTINRPPRDGRMAFIRSPDGISIELLQIGNALPLEEPWTSMQNTGSW
ncbi:MAG: lactoylglutathione lyase [Parcubacteria group bacterium Gr01-1014_8]|nr:MAG: lactoylglutathione lyase [Parcubacteria group bacterium Gr01-1014_8]